MKIFILLILFLAVHSGFSENSWDGEDPCGLLQDVPGETDCGYLEVPEDHDQPDSKKIKIAYVVLKALKKSPNHYPLIFLSGGPGSVSLTSDYLQYWAQSSYRQSRDLIIFDQRGINLSSELPNMEFDLFNVLAQDAGIEKERELISSVINDYKRRSLEQHIDLSKYNSFQNAQDVGALMETLGHSKYNLMGVSYGTRLARVVQDMFPQKIHSVVLNSPNPLGEDFLVSRLKSYSLALERIFNYCKEDIKCNASYPHLTETYKTAIKALNDKSLMITLDNRDMDFYVNAQDAVYLIRRELYGTNSREKVPALIHSFLHREPEKVRDIINSEIDLISHYNSSMWLSVERYEAFDPKYTAQVIDSIYTTLELFPARLGLFTSFYLAGHNWHNSVLPALEKTFKSSAVPTLIFVNQYDPVTPPEHGIIMKKDLSNSQLFIMDEGGHGGGDFICMDRVIQSFMDEPSRELDSSCLNLYHPGK